MIVQLYTMDGHLVPRDEISGHDPFTGLVAFDGGRLQEVAFCTPAELQTISAWLAYLAADSMRTAEKAQDLVRLFDGYPPGTTLGEILTGKAKRTEEN